MDKTFGIKCRFLYESPCSECSKTHFRGPYVTIGSHCLLTFEEQTEQLKFFWQVFRFSSKIICCLNFVTFYFKSRCCWKKKQTMIYSLLLRRNEELLLLSVIWSLLIVFVSLQQHLQTFLWDEEDFISVTSCEAIHQSCGTSLFFLFKSRSSFLCWAHGQAFKIKWKSSRYQISSISMMLNFFIYQAYSECFFVVHDVEA